LRTLWETILSDSQERCAVHISLSSIQKTAEAAMSRTRRRKCEEHGKCHRDGRRDAKGIGYEYGSRRPGNIGYMQAPFSGVKRLTHKRERHISANITRDELEAFEERSDD